jgi:hypothetical protein
MGGLFIQGICIVNTLGIKFLQKRQNPLKAGIKKGPNSPKS